MFAPNHLLNTQTPHTMDKFKKTTEAIDMAIASGAVTSVDMLGATLSIDNSKGAIKGRLVSYILEQHMDEEMEVFMQETMGYNPEFHRLNVDHQGNISF